MDLFRIKQYLVLRFIQIISDKIFFFKLKIIFQILKSEGNIIRLKIKSRDIRYNIHTKFRYVLLDKS